MGKHYHGVCEDCGKDSQAFRLCLDCYRTSMRYGRHSSNEDQQGDSQPTTPTSTKETE